MHTEQTIKHLSLSQLRKTLIRMGVKDISINYYNPANCEEMRLLILNNQR